MKYFKKFKNLDEFANHAIIKKCFLTVEGNDSVLLSSKDNSLTIVEDGKIKLDTSNEVVQSNILEGEYNAADSDLYILDSKVSGAKTSGNGKVITDDTKIVLNNIKVSSDAINGIYNVFEQPQKPKEITKSYLATNISVDGANVKHNIFNIYNLEDNAEVTVKNCDFDICMETTNVMRLANYKNAKNVKVTFENVNWTYENVGYDSSAIEWAGLIIFQPASTDDSLKGDMTSLQTWEFVFKNCSYNGEKVTSMNFGEPNQVMYMNNINRSGAVEDPMTFGLNIKFE